MATGKSSVRNIIINNQPKKPILGKEDTSTVTKSVELNVVGGALLPDERDINPGVNTNSLRN